MTLNCLVQYDYGNEEARKEANFKKYMPRCLH